MKRADLDVKECCTRFCYWPKGWDLGCEYCQVGWRPQQRCSCGRHIAARNVALKICLHTEDCTVFLLMRAFHHGEC